jgi:hypothetical protein
VDFTFECPACKKNFQVGHKELAKGQLKCCLCAHTPAPDIMTAYQNIGKTITDLYGCCECSDDKAWLPKEAR